MNPDPASTSSPARASRALVALLSALVLAALTGLGPAGTASAADQPKPTGSEPHFTTWGTYHGDVSRTGRVSRAPGLKVHQAWKRNFGEIDGEPLVVGSKLVAATQTNVVHGLDAATGKGRWHVSLGTPVPAQDLECGYLDAIGIISTPAYDPETHSLFVVAETTGGVHRLWALNPVNGKKKWSRNLDVMPDQNPLAVKNRAAILVVDGRVLVSFGSAGGDCGAYVGYLTSTPTSGKGAITEYHTPSTGNAGMWTPAGPVLGRNGSVYMAVGQGAATGDDEWDMSDSVTELDPVTMRVRSILAPSTWAYDNEMDLDLGSMTPAQLPRLRRQVIAGKAGTVYLLPEHLAGIGSELASLDGCNAYAGSAVVGNTVVMNCQVNRKIRLLRVGSESLSWGWTAPGKIVGSPVVAGNKVYVADRVVGLLYVLRLRNGSIVQKLPLGETTHFPTVSVDGGYVFANTMKGIVAYQG